MSLRRDEPRTSLWPFVAGLAAGSAGAVLLQALMASRRTLDPTLLRQSAADPDIPVTVLIPGILGSQLLKPDGTHVWFNFGNAFGAHDIGLPFRLPLHEARDDLRPGGLLGVDTVLPRLFGFTEYADVTALLADAGFGRIGRRARPGAAYHVFTYDWRRDLVEAARELHHTLEALAEALDHPGARFNLVGHSMGGLVARYYLRHGPGEPPADGSVSWAGARRVHTLTLVATPNAGSIPALETVLLGSRVGLSNTTLAVASVASMPSIYQLLPPRGAAALVDARGEPIDADLHDPLTWERHGWGPFAVARRRSGDADGALPDAETHRAFARAALRRAGVFHRALGSLPATPCPVPVLALGGDCLPTLARALVVERRGAPPRFEAWTRAEARHMFEAGDGRVTRASVLGSHLPAADEHEAGSGLPEIAQAFFGSADHHGIYGEATFQSVLLRRLLRPARAKRPAPLPAEV